jgi:hypothetical protein
MLTIKTIAKDFDPISWLKNPMYRFWGRSNGVRQFFCKVGSLINFGFFFGSVHLDFQGQKQGA